MMGIHISSLHVELRPRSLGLISVSTDRISRMNVETVADDFYGDGTVSIS